MTHFSVSLVFSPLSLTIEMRLLTRLCKITMINKICIYFLSCNIPTTFLSRVLDVLVYIHLHNVCPSHHTSYVTQILLYTMHVEMISIQQVHEKTAMSYQLLLAIEFLHHLYHTSRLLLLYILFQDAQLLILMACCAADVFCYVLIVCTSLQASQEKLDPVTRVCRCQSFITAYDCLLR